MKIKAGTVLVLEHGIYSDYSFDGPFKVLRDVDQAEVAEEFRAQCKPEYEWDSEPNERQFIAWLLQQGYVETMGAHHWHIGDYGFEPQIQEEPAP